jgi:hypothetical protein
MKTLKAKENLDKCSGRSQLSIAVEFWVSYHYTNNAKVFTALEQN